MSSRKLIAVLLAILSFDAIASYYIATRLSPKSQHEAPESRVYTPSVSDRPALLLMDESSGELTRVVDRDAKTGKIKSISCGYKDGRKGEYIFEQGKLRFYKGYDLENQLCFEAEYEATGLFASYRILRKDGSCQSQFRRLPDGMEELLFLNKSGLIVKSVVTTSDGTQSISTRKDLNKPAEVVVHKPEPSEKSFCPVKAEDGNQNFRFKFQLKGARIAQWEYRDAMGILRQKGRFNENGAVEITLVDQSGAPVLKQIWNCVGEDWQGKIYRLAGFEKLNSDGSLAGSMLLHSDGRTPKEVSNYYDGHKANTEYYDEGGFQYKQEYFDTNGFSNYSYEIPAQNRRKAELPEALTKELGDKELKLYSFMRAPYANALTSEGAETTPLFVLPK